MNNKILRQIKALDKAFNKVLPRCYFSFSDMVDQWLRWLPMTAVISAGRCGIETKSSYHKRLQLALAAAVISTIHWPVKHMVKRRRPGFLKNKKSFPSGHTVMAFAGAELFREQVKDTRPALAFPVYTVAVAAAVVRLGRKKHWLTDVLAGALCGIASAKLAKHLIKS